jgi:hypothetical protein
VRENSGSHRVPANAKSWWISLTRSGQALRAGAEVRNSAPLLEGPAPCRDGRDAHEGRVALGEVEINTVGPWLDERHRG